jgi:hypothetical protein
LNLVCGTHKLRARVTLATAHLGRVHQNLYAWPMHLLDPALRIAIATHC